MFQNLVKSVSNLVQSTSNSFPYTIGDEIFEWKQCAHKNNKNNNVWRLLEGTKPGTDEKVTIFAFENIKTRQQNRIDAALNCLNELKRIRHPHILSYIDGHISDDNIYFVTEYVYPLTACIENIGNAHKMNESFIALGLYQISKALSFVHNDLKYVHCLISPSSIFINKAGDFKLGSFELAHQHKNIPSHFLSNYDLLPNKYRPKELSLNNNDIINILINNPIHSIDAWCIGCIIFELFNSFNSNKFNKPQQLSTLCAIPYNLQSFYKRLLATKPSSRLTLLSLSDCDFIEENSLVQTSKFLSEIAIKSDNEKRQFLQHLDENIESYPSSICKYKILPALTHLLQHGFGSNPVILSCVLKISSLFINDENEKFAKIRPVVINMFKNNERGTRINLLKSLPKFINYLDSETISNDIWPQLINGFTDSSPVLREQSVRSVIHFTPKLSEKIITTQLLPLLDKIQSNDVEPAIRTNICIVLGKIAKFVNIKNNKDNELLLVRCFGRALNDKFIPCRNASLLSFAATIGLFSPNIIASKILPFIIKYTCDPYKTVRDSSFKCIQIGIQKLKQHALTLPDKPTMSQSTNNTDNDDTDNTYLGNVTLWAQRISGYSENQQQTENKNKKKNKPNLDEFFEENNNNKKEKKEDLNEKKENKEIMTKSIDDFLASFNDDLNKINKEKKPNIETTPKSKIKYKNKEKKEKKHKKHSKKKSKTKTKTKIKIKTKEKEKEKPEITDNGDADDFFDDW